MLSARQPSNNQRNPTRKGEEYQYIGSVLLAVLDVTVLRYSAQPASRFAAARINFKVEKRVSRAAITHSAEGCECVLSFASGGFELFSPRVFGRSRCVPEPL